MCKFVCGTVSHATFSFHWSVIHYQMTFEWHNWHSFEMSTDSNTGAQ